MTRPERGARHIHETRIPQSPTRPPIVGSTASSSARRFSGKWPHPAHTLLPLRVTMTPPASRTGKSKTDARGDVPSKRDGDVAGRVNSNASPASHKGTLEAHPAPNSGIPPSSGPPPRGPGTKLPSKPPPDPRRDARADSRESA